jgi:hypothetical protein
MECFLLKSFATQINLLIKNDPRLKIELNKIHGVLSNYCEEILKTDFEDLLLIKISDDYENLSENLTNFIAEYYLKKNPSPERAVQRDGEARTHAR